MDDESAFEIDVDGKLVFSKMTEGRFPLHPEIVKLVEKTKVEMESIT